jgi:anti-sigma factor RsiW
MSCQELVELVTAYLDGALPAQDVQALEAHLEHCDACAEYIEQMRTTIRLAAQAELQQRPDRDALLAAFRDFRRSRSDP